MGLIKIIKKRHVGDVRPAAPLVEAPPIPQPAKPKHSPAPIPAKNPKADDSIPYDKRPIAATLDELWTNQNTMRPPETRKCKACGHSYPYPCDGASNCMNLSRTRKAG